MKEIRQKVHLKIVHHFLYVRQKLITFLLMKQIILTLQCLSTICINIVITIKINKEAYGSSKEMKCQSMMLI